MKKTNKLSKIALTIVIASSPIATVLSCGFINNNKFSSISISGYNNIMNRLYTEDINLAGAWNDSRTQAPDTYEKVKVVGANLKRISNDGIIAKNSMSSTDLFIISKLFKKIVKYNSDDIYYKKIKNQNGKMIGFNPLKAFDFQDFQEQKFGDEISIMNSQNGNILKKQSVHKEVKISGNSEFFVNANSGISENSNWGEFKTKKEINMYFIPSNDPNDIQKAALKLSEFLNSKGIKCNVIISTSYDAAAMALNSGSFDLAVMSAIAWFENSFNAHFLLQSARKMQLNTLDFSGNDAKWPSTIILNSEIDLIKTYNAWSTLYVDDVKEDTFPKNFSKKPPELDFLKNFYKSLNDVNDPMHLYALKSHNFAKSELNIEHLTSKYESLIYSPKNSDPYNYINNKIKQQGENWIGNINDIIIRFGYTSTESSATFFYPEDWLSKHFKDFKSIK